MGSKLASFLAYAPLQAAMLPVGVAGATATAYRQLMVSRRLGVSQTAVEVLNGRYTMHRFGIREDEAAAKLLRALPNASAVGLDLALFPLWVKHQISKDYFLYPRVVAGGTETLADLIVARTLFIDDIIHKLIGDAEQFVVLGAGFDTRAYGELQERGVQIFELDKADTQGLKRKSLERAGIPAEHVRYVSIDFTRDRIFEKLEEAGYAKDRRTVFLWEGVTLYLDEASIRATLRDVKANSAPGSAVIADFYASSFVNMGKFGAIKRTLDLTGEPLAFGLPFGGREHEETMQAFIRSNGFEPGAMHFLGGARSRGPFAAVVELTLS